MKSFLVKIIMISLPVLLLTISTNYFGDAAELFNKSFEIEMSKILLSKSNVTNISNYNERVLQKEIIFSMKESPEVIVLGSSRSMFIDSSYFPGQSFFNHSVSGASLNDMISIFQMYMEREFVPKKILVCIDPWTFNANNNETRWEANKEFFDKYYGLKSNDWISSYTIDRYKQLISFSYFQKSFKKLTKKLKTNSNPLSTKEKFNKSATRLPDGSLVYGEKERNASPEEIENLINNYFVQGAYGLDRFDKVSTEIWSEFETFIGKLKSKEIELEFFLSPYAPNVYNRLKKDFKTVLKVEQKMKSFAKNEQIELHGSFNPSFYSFGSIYFYDGMHPKENGVRKIFQKD